MQPANQNGGRSPIQRAVERRLRELAIIEPGTVSSWGERLLPLFSAALETCWLGAIFIGLASLNLFFTREPLLPLWAPFVIIVSAYWLALRLERHAVEVESTTTDQESATTVPGTSRFVVLMGIIILCLLWLRFYTQAGFLLDPRWLLALLTDILLLNLHAWQALFLTAIACYLCWRGVHLTRKKIEPADINFSLYLGLGIILAVILLRAGQESAGVVLHDETVLLVLVPIFLVLALAAHALARVTFVRSGHPVGLEGNAHVQERAMLLVIASIGLILLIVALIIGNAASPAVLADTQRALAPLWTAYTWLVGVIAQVAIFVLTPFVVFLMWLIALIHPSPAKPIKRPSSRPPQPPPSHKPATVPPDALIALTTALKFAIPVLFILLMFLLIRRIVQQRRVRPVTKRQEDDERESVWSWSLFWMQVRLLLRTLLGRFLPQRTPQEHAHTVLEEIKGEPAVRSIREIYRALLQKAALRGYPRKKDETPYEFEQRLDSKVPVVEPQLAEITAVYAATRYGGAIPDDAELARVRGLWVELDHKWREV